CEEEISINTPAFEATNGYTFWRAAKVQAIVDVDKGDLVIVGADDAENITLYIENYDYGKEYTLGISNVNVATYSKMENDTVYRYSTSSSTGNGYIKLDPVEKQKPGTITGTFFAEMEVLTGSPVLFDESGNPITTMNFNKGVFFEIPLTKAEQPESENPEDGEPGEGTPKP
ncbi:MAG TPA: DUF6252 family protein, partial [Flavobacteriaceae bacterium]|nr:DUF6252 family protein [Flavobacteriaceae bacterium]